MKALAVFAAVCVVYVSAQAPRLCDAPKALTGKLFADDSRQSFRVFANWTYDAVGERIRVDESIRTDRSNESDYYDTIMLFKERVKYRINLRTRECQKSAMSPEEKFLPLGIPTDARSFGEAVIGTTAGQGIGVIVSLWGGTSPIAPDARYFGTWTEEACLPVQQIHTIPNSQSRDIVRQNFFDLVIGFDPNRFIPPSNCM